MHTQVICTTPTLAGAASPPLSRDVQELFFRGFVINGGINVGSLADFYCLKVSAASRAKTVAEYLAESLYHYPLPGDRVTLGNIGLIVLKKSGRVVEQVTLDFNQTTSIAKDHRQ
jgi:NhaP-type Na+/H+ and K+/H+ antiporter